MRRFIYLFFLIVLFACKSNENKSEQGNIDSTKTLNQKTEYTCPMHPDVISDKAGSCPQCGMDLEAKS